MIKNVAPRELIQSDFQILKSAERLNTTPEIEDIIFMQSLEGRAHNGAGAFHKRSYVNTSIDDIVKALGRNPALIKSKRQALIDDIVDYAKAIINGERRDMLINDKGSPFLGIPDFKTRKVNPHDILKGLFMGGLRDDAEIRKTTEYKYNVKVGCGKCYLVNARIMESLGLDGEILAHQAHEDDIETYVANGLIINPERLYEAHEDEIKYFYIRHRIGPGQSDDAAVVASGMIYNSDVAIGVFLADAIDTLEKYAPNYSDQDNDLACYIKENYDALDISYDEVYELAYLAAIPEGREEEVPDSSMRYLLTVDPVTGQSTIESHLNFVEGRPYYPMAISYKRILITDFYDYIKDKVRRSKVPSESEPKELLIEGLNKSVKELMKKNVVVVSPNVTLEEALSKVRDTRVEIIVVQDANKKVIGVINPDDFLYLLRRT